MTCLKYISKIEIPNGQIWKDPLILLANENINLLGPNEPLKIILTVDKL